MGKKKLKVIGQQIQAPVKSLITRQARKPIKPLFLNKLMNLSVIEPLVQLPEQINGNDFFVRKNGLEIAQALIFQRALIIVELADEQINLNELIFHKQKNLIILCLSAFLLLIHIKYIIYDPKDDSTKTG